MTSPLPSAVSLLFVATVSSTIRHFLIPYAMHFRSLGWRVEAAASGCTTDVALRGAFDNVHELPLSRSILDLRGIVRSERAISKALESRPDIVHVHTPIAGFVTRVAARRTPAVRRPPLAYTAHGFHFHRDGRAAPNAVFLTAERVAGRWTDRLIVVNDEDYEAARRNRIVTPNCLVRMPGIGIDTRWFSPSSVGPDDLGRVCGEFGVRPDAPLFVVVGELNANKRQADVIAALASMRRTQTQLLLLGDGPDRAALEMLVDRLCVRDRVWFAGFVEDVRPVLGSATALVLASGREGLSRAIMEALALEVPVIASTARGNRELVGTDSGFIVPTGDVRGLAAAMDWLIDHRAEGREMGRRGRARMVERYDLQDLIRLHETMYREMLTERSTRRR